MQIFDGYQFAEKQKARLKERAQRLAEKGIHPVIGAILFNEDAGSQLYTRLKREAADELGIEYRVSEHSLTGMASEVELAIERFNSDPEVTGIIIQKPWRKTWSMYAPEAPTDLETQRQAFQMWWEDLTKLINHTKDVDGLHPATLAALKAGNWHKQKRVLPATCRAVLAILGEASALPSQTPNLKYLVVGRSDIVGLPLTYALKSEGAAIDTVGVTGLQKLLSQPNKLQSYDVVVSATGASGFLTGDALKAGVVIVDVGEPRPDIDQKSVAAKARFITPVPGGVGPVTVVSLLENCLDLAEKH